MVNAVLDEAKVYSRKSIKVMPYDESRMRNALLKSGVPKDGLEEYIKRTSNNELYYKNSIHLPGDKEVWDDIAADVLMQKYLAKDKGEKGPLGMQDRVARALASVEKGENKEKWYSEFLGMLQDFEFVPGGRIMHGAGRENVRRPPTLSNCYVVGIDWTYKKDELAVLNIPKRLKEKAQVYLSRAEVDGVSYHDAIEHLNKIGIEKAAMPRFLCPPDSLEGIYKAVTTGGYIYRTGGGVGTDLSALRPKGAHVNSTIDDSPGATAFMNLFSENTETVAQSNRRGALMLTMRVDHPDIEWFINIKNDKKRTKAKHANISVLVTHEFMDAVINNKDFTLHWKNEDELSNSYGQEIKRVVKAVDIWDKIITNAHASAEPGIIFWDTMRDYHNVEYVNPLSSTNPCGEQPLAKNTACNLGNLNLTRFVKEDGTFDYVKFAARTRTATRFMDNIIDYNMPNHANPEIQRAVYNDRRVGLGITGLADALIMMGIKYDSEEALVETEKIMKTLRDNSYQTSIDLAKERGAFPQFEWKGYSKSKFVQSLPKEIQKQIKKHGIRNGTVITMPPVGTGSIVARTSSGIEPVLFGKYERVVKQGDRGETKKYTVYHHLFREMFGGVTNLPPHVVTAHEIDAHFRVRMQGVIQKYVDSSISSTVNLAEATTVEAIKEIYMDAYKHGLKGITIYRNGSRQPIMSESLENKVADKIEPKKISRIMPSITFKQATPIGTLHLHTVYDPKDNYKVLELFGELGFGGTQETASLEAINRLISRQLRKGDTVDEIIEQLGGIGGTDAKLTAAGLVSSVPQGLTVALKKFLVAREMGQIDNIALGKIDYDRFDATASEIIKAQNGEWSYNAFRNLVKSHMPEQIDGKVIVVKTTNANQETNQPNGREKTKSTPCPDCGTNIEHQGGCTVCYNCGWAKC